MKPEQLYLATFFVAKLGAPTRSVFVRASSFAEAEAHATKVAEPLEQGVVRNGAPPLTLGGILIEFAPEELPPLESRTRNGVNYLVQRRVSR